MQYISVRETTKMLGIRKTTVFKLLKDGELKSTKIGSKRLVDYDSIVALVQKGKK